MRMQRENHESSRGFSLIELMIAITVFAFVAAALYSLYIRSQRSEAIGMELSEAEQNARAALQIMNTELRSAGYGVDPDSTVPVLVASEERITFVVDRNRNGSIELGETVTYFLDPDTGDAFVSTTPNPRDRLEIPLQLPPPVWVKRSHMVSLRTRMGLQGTMSLCLLISTIARPTSLFLVRGTTRQT